MSLEENEIEIVFKLYCWKIILILHSFAQGVPAVHRNAIFLSLARESDRL